MEEEINNAIVHISNRSHLNITFNLLQCGNNDILPGSFLSLTASDGFTFVYINGGSALLETDDFTFKVNDHQGFFSFSDTNYKLRNLGDENLKITWLSFTGYSVEGYLMRANIFRSNPTFIDLTGEIGVKINKIYELAYKMPNRYCPMMSILYDIFSHLLDTNPTKDIARFAATDEFFVSKAADYIFRNYSLNISIDDMARKLGISRKHLYSVFKRVMKISPSQYLIYYRMEKACKYLKDSPLSILEISELVGYSNQFYFSKEFKRLTGMTPSKYKKNPSLIEVFSYRAFAPTLKDEMDEFSIGLPVDEVVMSVIVSGHQVKKQDMIEKKGEN